MRCIYVVIDVSLVIAHRGLISGEPPVAVDDELVLVHAPLQGHQKRELVAPALLHRDALLPLAEAAYEEHFLAPEVPGEDGVHEVLLLWLWLLIHRLLSRRIFRQTYPIPKYAAIVRLRIRKVTIHITIVNQAYFISVLLKLSDCSDPDFLTTFDSSYC